jgi:proteasome lid subunit RPN8/RPN11
VSCEKRQTRQNWQVVILQSAVDAIVAHAQETAPDECCGLLVGAGDRIDQAIRARNLERGPARYRIDPRDHIALMKRLRGSDRDVIGAYHSHPRSSAAPSASDVAEAFYPDFVYLIVSLMTANQPECRAWRLRDGAAEEIALLREPVSQAAPDPE